MRIHIAIGITPDGDYTALYVGDDAAAARDAVEEAGASGAITAGYHFANPQGIPHKRRRFPENRTAGSAAPAYSHRVEPKEPLKEQPKPAAKAKPAAKKARPAAKPETTDEDPFALGK